MRGGPYKRNTYPGACVGCGHRLERMDGYLIPTPEHVENGGRAYRLLCEACAEVPAVDNPAQHDRGMDTKQGHKAWTYRQRQAIEADTPLAPNGEAITVTHPLYGGGEVCEIRRNPLGKCRCIDCRFILSPAVVMLVRWFEPVRAGCAGGWYDPACKVFDFEPAELVEARLLSLLAEDKRGDS